MDKKGTFENAVSPDLQPHTLEIELPPEANRNHIKAAAGRAADYFVIEVGISETDAGFKIGVRNPKDLQDVIDYLTPEIERSVGMDDREANFIRYAHYRTHRKHDTEFDTPFVHALRNENLQDVYARENPVIGPDGSLPKKEPSQYTKDMAARNLKQAREDAEYDGPEPGS